MEQLEVENPRTWFPACPQPGELLAFGVVDVIPTNPPPHDLADGSYVCSITEHEADVWVQTWEWVPHPAMDSVTQDPS